MGVNGKRILAVIPARGGSKSVPGKNLKPVGGKPLLVHTIEQALAVPEFDVSVVSTDDPEIAGAAAQAGMRVIRRPAELATDEAPTEAALLHALDDLAAAGQAPFDHVAILEPTSPRRRVETVRRCVEQITAGDFASLMTVEETRANIGRLQDGVFRPLDAKAPRRRQLRQPFFIECGVCYICRTDYLRRTGSIVADPWLAVAVDAEEALDINTPLDFQLAQLLFERDGHG